MRKDIAAHYIDTVAGEARGKYISVGIGQESTYLFKSMQAKEYKNVDYTGIVPCMIQVEADVTGYTPQQVADSILDTEALWVGILAGIEKIRRSAKITLSTLEDPTEIENLCEQTIELLKNL
jgi:hypothetical protein